MSTLNVDAIVSSSGGNTATINGQTLNADTIVGGRRNIIQNGKFQLDQRHGFGSHTVSAGSDFFADRWGFYTSSNAFAEYGATTEVVNDGPDGFERSMKWTTSSTTGAGVPATGEVIFRQKLEGYNINHVNYGSANARDMILSFYVKSSIAGNYGLQCQFTDSGGTNRYLQRSYTVSAANTWERVSVTIPKNTANVMQQKTNGVGLALNWDLGEGATYSSAASTSWGTTYTNGLTGGVKVAEVNGATWQITGVQLELGDVVSPFEHLSYAEELAICQRMYQRINSDAAFDYGAVATAIGTTSRWYMPFPLKTEMRTDPTLSFSNVSHFRITLQHSSSDACSAFQINYNHNERPQLGCTAGSNSAGAVRMFGFNGSSSAHLALDAEL